MRGQRPDLLRLSRISSKDNAHFQKAFVINSSLMLGMDALNLI